jgi:hypothetical protein
MAFTFANPLKPVKNLWDRFSISSKDKFKSAAKWGIAVPVAGFFLTTIGIGVLVLAGVGLAAAKSAVSFWRNDMAKELKQGQTEQVWTNEAGQQLRGTLNQRHDMTTAQKRIDRVVKGALGLSAGEQRKVAKIKKHFNASAEKISVIKDIAGNDGAWRYAQKYRQIVVQQRVKPL